MRCMRVSRIETLQKGAGYTKAYLAERQRECAVTLDREATSETRRGQEPSSKIEAWGGKNRWKRLKFVVERLVRGSGGTSF